MGSVSWRGVTSRNLYTFMTRAIPAALIGTNQQPLQKATFNGETVVIANHDGSVARAVATGPPAGASVNPESGTPPGKGINSIYDAYTTASLFEQS